MEATVAPPAPIDPPQVSQPGAGIGEIAIRPAPEVVKGNPALDAQTSQATQPPRGEREGLAAGLFGGSQTPSGEPVSVHVGLGPSEPAANQQPVAQALPDNMIKVTPAALHPEVPTAPSIQATPEAQAGNPALSSQAAQAPFMPQSPAEAPIPAPTEPKVKPWKPQQLPNAPAPQPEKPWEPQPLPPATELLTTDVDVVEAAQVEKRKGWVQMLTQTKYGKVVARTIVGAFALVVGGTDQHMAAEPTYVPPTPTTAYEQVVARPAAPSLQAVSPIGERGVTTQEPVAQLAAAPAAPDQLIPPVVLAVPQPMGAEQQMIPPTQPLAQPGLSPRSSSETRRDFAIPAAEKRRFNYPVPVNPKGDSMSGLLDTIGAQHMAINISPSDPDYPMAQRFLAKIAVNEGRDVPPTDDDLRRLADRFDREEFGSTGRFPGKREEMLKEFAGSVEVRPLDKADIQGDRINTPEVQPTTFYADDVAQLERALQARAGT